MTVLRTAVATVAGHGRGHQLWGALSLYLDFINLFQFLLAFFGNRR